MPVWRRTSRRTFTHAGRLGLHAQPPVSEMDPERRGRRGSPRGRDGEASRPKTSQDQHKAQQRPESPACVGLSGRATGLRVHTIALRCAAADGGEVHHPPTLDAVQITSNHQAQ